MKYFSTIAKQLRVLRKDEAGTQQNKKFEDKICEIIKKHLNITANSYEESCQNRKKKAPIDESDGLHELDLGDMFGDLYDGLNQEAV